MSLFAAAIRGASIARRKSSRAAGTNVCDKRGKTFFDRDERRVPEL